MTTIKKRNAKRIQHNLKHEYEQKKENKQKIKKKKKTSETYKTKKEMLLRLKMKCFIIVIQ